jgi:hypothetical protein
MRNACSFVFSVVLAVLVLGSGVAAAVDCRAGVAVGGACWFLGETGQSCTEVCAAVGFPYDEATRTYAGSDGTDEHCDLVLDALGAFGSPVFAIDCSPDGLGCVKESGSMDRFRCSDPTEPDAGESGLRACACRAGGVPAPALSPLSLAVALGTLLGVASWRLRRHLTSPHRA